MSLYRAVTDRRYRRNRFLRFYRHLVRTGSAFPRLPRRFAPRNDKSDSFAPPNYCCKTCDCQWRSLTAATDAIGAYHFNDGLYQSRVPRREGHAPPLQWRVQSPRVPGNLQLPMAVTPRKGHAATDAIGFYVFIGTLYELEVPSRDCHVGRWPPRNDKPLAFTVLSIACTGRQHCAGPGCPLPTTHGRRPAYFSVFIFQFSGFISMRPLPYNAFPAALRKIPRSAFHVFFHKFSLSCA